MIKIRISSLGLADNSIRAYAAHEKGNWALADSDYQKNPLRHRVHQSLETVVEFVPGEQFKIVVAGLTEHQARAIFDLRSDAGVMVGTRFDFDQEHNTFWLLAPAYPVVNWGAWNQNNIVPTE